MSRRAIALALLCAAGAAGAAQTYSADSKSSKEYGYFIKLPPGNSPIDAAFTQCAGNICYDNRVQAGPYGQATRNRIASRGYTVTSADSTSATMAGGSMSLQASQAGAAGLVAATVTLRLLGDSAIVADESSVAWAGFYLSLTAAQSWATLSEYEAVRIQPPDDPSYRMWRSGPDTVTASLNLPVGSFNWFLLLQTAAKGYTQLGQYSAQSTFSVSFIEGQPVFALPEGYSVWSQDFNIVDNQWCPNGCAPVPEPGSWALLGLGVLAFLSHGLIGRQGRRRPVT